MPILANGRLCMQHFRPKTSYDTGKMSVNLAGPGSLRLSPMISFSPQFWSQIPDFDHKYCKYIAPQNLYNYCSRSIASGRASLLGVEQPQSLHATHTMLGREEEKGSLSPHILRASNYSTLKLAGLGNFFGFSCRLRCAAGEIWQEASLA